MTNGNVGGPPERIATGLWGQLAETPTAWLIALISFVSGPLAFLSQYGTLWFFGVLSIALWGWWWGVCNARRQMLNAPPGERIHSRMRIGLSVLAPALATMLFVVLAYLNITELNFWRRDYTSPIVRTMRYGSVTKFFDETAPRTTPAEKARHKQNEWFRWLEAGAKAMHDGSEVLFIESEPFSDKFRTFTIEVHDHDKKLRPTASGIALLVHDVTGDAWYRPIYRELPCDFAGDASSLLYRVEVQNAEPGESLWLFLCVTPTVASVALDTLDLQLTVR